MNQRNILLGNLNLTWGVILFLQVLFGLAVSVFPPLLSLIIIFCVAFVAVIYHSPTIMAVFLLLLVLPYPFSFFQIGQADIGLLEVGVFLAFISWAARGMIRDKSLFVDIKELEIPILILLGWAAFSVLWTPYVARGLHGVLKIASSFSIYFLTVNLIKDRPALERLFVGWLLISVLFSILGMYQMFSLGIEKSMDVAAVSEGQLADLGKTVRVTTILRTPNDLGFFLMLPITLLLVKIFQPSDTEGPGKNSGFMRFILACLLIAEIMIIAVTFSRKSWLSLGLIIALIGLMYKRILVFSALSAVFATMVLFIMDFGAFGELLKSRAMSFLFPIEAAIPERAVAWEIGKELFYRSPIIGNGLGSFFVLSSQFNSPLNLPHNFYIFLLTELGLVGLSLFLIVAIVFSKNLLEIKHGEYARLMATGLFACFCAILFQAFFRTIALTDPVFWAFMGLLSVFIRQYNPYYRKDDKPATKDKSLTPNQR